MRNLTLAALLVLGTCATAHAQTGPDIITIVTDDLDVQLLNDAVARGFMPNFAARFTGLHLPNTFVTNPLCAPSRGTLFSGQYSHNHGVLQNPPFGGVNQFDDSDTLATRVAGAGYSTALVGKYINGYGEQIDPAYVPPGWGDWHATIYSDGAGFRHGINDDDVRYQINDNGVVTNYGWTDEEYPTDVSSAKAVAAVGYLQSPFFLYIATTAPHSEPQNGIFCQANNGDAARSSPATRDLGLAAGVPLPMGPSFNEADLSDKPGWFQDEYPLMTQENIDCLNAIYQASLEAMMGVDDLIGSVFAATDARGTTANTVFVFMSDNGFLYGQHRGRQKQLIYDPAIRVPMYIVGPGVPAGTNDAWVLNNDFAPTIAELAGTTLNNPDGRSFVPLFSGGAWTRSQFMIEHFEGLVVPDWWAVQAARLGRVAKYARYDATTEEAYDLVNDPDEINSLNPPWKTFLRKRLGGLRNCVGAQCISKEDGH